MRPVACCVCTRHDPPVEVPILTAMSTAALAALFWIPAIDRLTRALLAQVGTVMLPIVTHVAVPAPGVDTFGLASVMYACIWLSWFAMSFWLAAVNVSPTFSTETVATEVPFPTVPARRLGRA